jgi:hypothetical protein
VSPGKQGGNEGQGAAPTLGEGQGQDLSRNTEAGNNSAGAALPIGGNEGNGGVFGEGAAPVQRPNAPTLSVSGGTSVPQSVELAQSSFTTSVNGETVSIRATDGRNLGDFTATLKGGSQTRGLSAPSGEVVVSLRGLRNLSSTAETYDSGEVSFALLGEKPGMRYSKQVGALIFTVTVLPGNEIGIDVRLSPSSGSK